MVAVSNRGGATMKDDKRAPIVNMNNKGQVTIPARTRKNLGLGDEEQFQVIEEDGRIVLNPVIIISKDQAWYWTEEWQKGERDADMEIKAGRTKSFNSVDALLEDLFDDED
ncbi:AbrB/MazE/SpoVT family DNA-binding domain-containing protein [Paenisporosarcina sp. TG20]|uniref:AbrB/MazE/SpoVT family DNA-binding domain-containing protein n=1 Tax=Paenisporosarcina sp. TG20 TaxID=1211706 RepID=UPI00035E30FF|nr:AbrB/MazE/SpoVT family DNA-binding domain-containing protein [Paenisporosarcina sp. TG20]